MRAFAVGLVVIAACRPAVGVRADGGDAAAGANAKTEAQVEAAAQAQAALAQPEAADATADEQVVDVQTDWCVAGMLGLDEDVCYVRPERRATKLLVYLHGIVPPTKESAQKQGFQAAVVAATRRAGAVAMVPRGRRGIGPEGARDWWAWPSPASQPEMVKTIVARWVEMKRRLEVINGAPFEATYLAGSSNGAYFLAALALRGDCDALGFPIDGYGAMSGGSPGGRGAAALKGRAPRPMYIGHGTYDATTKNGAKALAAVFEAAGWPVKRSEHPVGHGAREVYLDEAFAFWAAAADDAGRR